LLNRTRIRVIYADTDAMGIVYHANYLKWFEVGRTELFRDLGIVYADWKSVGVTMPVTRAFCHYLLPAYYDDLIIVETEIEYVRRASIKFRNLIKREDDQALLVTGYTVHACLNREGRIIRLPERMLSMIAERGNKQPAG